MSTSSRSDTDDSFYDVEELLHIEARCRELRREKDLLKETQSQSFELTKRLELHVRRLNEACLEDKRRIQVLERELSNCHQEIDYLQDLLNAKNSEVDCLEELVSSLEMRLADVDLLEQENVNLREELNKSNSECEFLMQQLETKETELQKSSLHIGKLEESISSAALEYECELEGMRLDMLALEQRCFEAEKCVEERSQEKDKLSNLLHELEQRFDDAQKTVKDLENENKQVKVKLDASRKEIECFSKRVEEHFKGSVVPDTGNVAATREAGPYYSDILGPLLMKVLRIGTSGVDHNGRRETTSCQLHEYKELVKQLKEELRNEKTRAKDEAEDLAQEMAELRYQMTELLEEERKRRACIEQASLQRISELEAQLQMEQRKPVASIRPICEAQKPL